jgi:hypothetical protein
MEGPSYLSDQDTSTHTWDTGCPSLFAIQIHPIIYSNSMFVWGGLDTIICLHRNYNFR